MEKAKLSRGLETTGVYLWLTVLLERHAAMLESLSPSVEWSVLSQDINLKLTRGEAGNTLSPEETLSRAAQHAQQRGAEKISERDIAAIVIEAAGLTPQAGGPLPAGAAEEAAAGEGGRSGTGATAATAAPKRSLQPTPTLDRFGRDLTELARQGKLPPVVGREEEIEQVIVTLCRQTKRNPILLGPAGVGKTAIVEGLARRVAAGEVSEALRGVRIVEVQPSTLMAGAGVFGEPEKRMSALVKEASQEGIILFIDEAHTIIGSGGRMRTGDLANVMKPALAKGDIACIAATTDDEYRIHIESDRALERRFSPVRVQEMTPEQTREVLATLRDHLRETRGVEAPDGVLDLIIEMSGLYLKNRHFPDKAVDLLEHCVAHAVAGGRGSVDAEEAASVVEAMVGMPLDVDKRLLDLAEALKQMGLMKPDQVDGLTSRLRVTVRSMDFKSARPNAVILMGGDAGEKAGILAMVIAEKLLGARERVVDIDLGRMSQPYSLSMLIGAGPGYVGYEDRLPLHRVMEMPWSVLCLRNMHSCHPDVQEVVTQGLDDGHITLADGKRVFLCDTIVILTAGGVEKAHRPVGFGSKERDAQEISFQSMGFLGEKLLKLCDLVIAEDDMDSQSVSRFLENFFLAEMRNRYRKRGVDVCWESDLVRYLAEKAGGRCSQGELERLIDEQVTSLLAPYLITQRKVTLKLEVGGEGAGLTAVEIEGDTWEEKADEEGGV
ncbi:MAG: ATP-dependent Clp protease ATP-binding subunit [Actinobacteria bacterium]|nr:ATP-dependent Clp protease ATP-binding subunit [Actinomycetota bacterium]